MKNSLNISQNPAVVSEILSALRKDVHLSKTFEGSAKNGQLTGIYTNMALINKMFISYVKIRGTYDLEKGNLNIKVSPSRLFWIVIILLSIALIVLCFQGFGGNKSDFIGPLFVLFMMFVFTLIYFFESRSFLKHVIRIRKLKDN